MDSDLYSTLQYVSNDNKTDERMTATKKRFGKTGGNVSYHGYQSFQTGEVTPEEAHEIGLEGERQSIYNRNRHKKSDELNAQAKEITAKIKLLRKELSTAKAILEKIPKLKELLETERQMETAIAAKHKNGGDESTGQTHGFNFIASCDKVGYRRRDFLSVRKSTADIA